MVVSLSFKDVENEFDRFHLHEIVFISFFINTMPCRPQIWCSKIINVIKPSLWMVLYIYALLVRFIYAKKIQTNKSTPDWRWWYDDQCRKVYAIGIVLLYYIEGGTYIYIGQPPEKPRPMGLHTEVSGLTARGDIGGTLNSLKHHPNGPLMGRAKPHAWDGLEAQVPTT
jgi:hypothetical protein